MTIGSYIKCFEKRLSALEWYDRREVKSMAIRLLEEIAGVPPYKVIVEPQMELSADVAARLEQMTVQLATGRPLQYVLGYEIFCGHRFAVSEGVLIPRPETEELVHMVLNDIQQNGLGADFATVEDNHRAFPLRVLDICTGSGCIAWSIAAGVAEMIRSGSCVLSGGIAENLSFKGAVWGCDISDTALQIASLQGQGIYTDSVEKKGWDVDRPSVEPEFFKCDILDAGVYEIIMENICKVVGDGDGEANRMQMHKLDIIVSNPPYVCEQERSKMRPNVLDFEPDCALFVPDDNPLLFYRRIAQLGGKLLKPGGRLYFETNERFAVQTAHLMEEYDFKGCRVVDDLFGKPRFVVGVLA